jgi:hypothetical protein
MSGPEPAKEIETAITRVAEMTNNLLNIVNPPF